MIILYITPDGSTVYLTYRYNIIRAAQTYNTMK